MCYTLYSVFRDNFWVTLGKSGHLVWNTDGNGLVSSSIIGIVYLIGLFYGLCYGLPLTIPLLMFGVISLIWAVQKTDRHEFGSYWCFIAVGYSILCLLI